MCLLLLQLSSINIVILVKMAVREIRASPLINYGVRDFGPNGIEGEMDTFMDDKDLPPQKIHYHLIVT